MIYVWFTAALLIVAGLLAWGMVKVRRDAARAISAIATRERDVAERLAKIEAALSEKAPAASSRDLAAMVDGVASICYRMEARLSSLEGKAPAPGHEPAGD